MSSPTYDNQIEEPSQDDLNGFDEIEQRLTQSSQDRAPETRRATLVVGESSQDSDTRRYSSSPDDSLHRIPPLALTAFAPASSIHPVDPDPDNPFIATTYTHSGFTSALMSCSRRQPSPSSNENTLLVESSGVNAQRQSTAIPDASPSTNRLAGFASASRILSENHVELPSSSLEEPSEKDYSSWFSSTALSGPVGFASARHVEPHSTPQNPPPTVLFTTAAMKKFLAPSETALQEAEARMKRWEVEAEAADIPSLAEPPSPPRQVLGAVENSFVQGRVPDSPGPLTGFGRPPSSGFRPPFQTPSGADIKGKGFVKPFKSPLLRDTAVPLKAPVFAPSPLNPNRSRTMAAAAEDKTVFTSARGFRPLIPSTPKGNVVAGPSSLATPVRQAAFSTPPRPMAVSLRAGQSGKKKFVSPFKPGMRPGEPGRAKLGEKYEQGRAAAVASLVVVSGSIRSKEKGSARMKVFNLKPPPNRQTLASSGLSPEAYSKEELTAKGINVAELSQITPEMAIYYSFYSALNDLFISEHGSPIPENALGPGAALNELKKIGCTLATKAWVDNHWGLILWKLAGMACLDPAREGEGEGKRWCWGEVMRQLRYRYEKELNGGQRPAFRLVTTQDSPAACPMILCVSNIFWSKGGIGDDEEPIIPHPELEVTDGWYKLRAQVDGPLARAVRKGSICVGRKIAVAGAKLSTGKSEPCEVLDAYNSCHLILSGNSSHLAPWHAKLGFQPSPPVATLNSLTPDGGAVQLMDLTVVKTYPIAFIEFYVDEDGRKRRKGPRKEKEEAQIQDQWQKRRDHEEARLRTDFFDKLEIYESWVDRLERKVSARFEPSEDETMPSHIENIFDILDTGKNFNDVTKSITFRDAYYLAKFTRERIEKERETMVEDIERDLKHVCPPRDVRGFRVLFMKDACASRKPAHLIAEVTVWDVLDLQFDEGRKPGHFTEGERFFVSLSRVL
ncbi:hypothetical protein EW146_g2694 [Bondarzewia mesenterica]|uniref:BRCA2 OB1 domain-containing protein n=1 Tax=Bondarzewia mesenterica TaxID=1095465 RepID=A0A4S4LZU2_9AGAM|nr:hypothetical protein EW146_g2694 [Bondarzewia mesenterica]